MLAMGLKFLSQNTDPDSGAFCVGGIVVATIFGAKRHRPLSCLFRVLKLALEPVSANYCIHSLGRNLKFEFKRIVLKEDGSTMALFSVCRARDRDCGGEYNYGAACASQ
eukprot:COSAG06_NODE_15458_length_1069_cov_8.224742_1_plen_109_part_00